MMAMERRLLTMKIPFIVMGLSLGTDVRRLYLESGNQCIGVKQYIVYIRLWDILSSSLRLDIPESAFVKPSL